MKLKETSWHILKKIIGQPAKSSTGKKYHYNSDRYRAILNELPQDKALTQPYHGNRSNIYRYGELNPDLRTLMFLAHHDIVLPSSQNPFDNTASVANLIQLGRDLDKEPNLNINVVIAFSDGEELGSYTNSGSAIMASSIKQGHFGDVMEVVNLELTARGNIIWGWGKSDIVDFDNVLEIDKTPFSDTKVMLRYGIPSSVVGIFTPKDKKQFDDYGMCDTWRLCHTHQDAMNLVVRKDMWAFVDFLKSYALHVSALESKRKEKKLGIY